MLYFLVYNDDTHNYFLNNLVESVKKYGKNFEIIIFDKNDMDKDFVLKNQNILELKRGGGYWLWKPYIINETLKKMNDGDMVFYLDSKYYFIEEFTNLYSEYMKNNDLLVWKNKPNTPGFDLKNWCKMDVILKYNMFDKIFNENVEDCWGGALIVKKTQNTVKYMQEWLDMCCNYDDITDSPSKAENSSSFIEHRHDQCLLSIILHKNNIEQQFLESRYLQNVRTPFSDTKSSV